MYTQLGVLTKGTIIEVNTSELGMVTTGGKVVWSKYAQVMNSPENDGCVVSSVFSICSCPGLSLHANAMVLTCSSSTERRTSRVEGIPPCTWLSSSVGVCRSTFTMLSSVGPFMLGYLSQRFPRPLSEEIVLVVAFSTSPPFV